MPQTRFPMFLKFWVGCAALAALLIAGGVLVVRSETKMKSRGNYLKKHFDRYLAYQEGLGKSVASLADVIASDELFRRSLSDLAKRASDGDALDPTASATPTEAASPRDLATNLAQRLFKTMSADGGLQPDLFAVFDRSGVIFASPGSGITKDNVRELEPATRLRQGQAFFDKTFVHDNRVVQLAGVPILATGTDNEVVGGVIVGVNLERYLKDFKEQSDPKEEMQYRMVLVHKDHVVASVFPGEMWDELAEQLKETNWGIEKEGEMNRATIRLKQGDYDFYQGEAEGFAGVASGKVGDLFLLRSRRNLVGRGPQVPWIEMLIGAVLSLLVASLLALWITRPIKRFVHQSQKMLAGGADLNQRLETRSNDETAALAANINQVFSRTYQLASEVQGAAFQVGASSAEISAASKNMLEGLRDQTVKIESSTAAVTELSASIQQVAANAVEATNAAEKSNVSVQAAVQRMQQIRGTVEDAAMKMTELGESSKRIGNIVEVIRQISEQTSLLALNASIEAAHAGEQGRGFAVVADEVSSLARRVGQSAKDIEALIQTIKEQTAEAIRSMELGTAEVEGGTHLVADTLTDLSQVISVVRDTAAAVQEQALVSDEIARNMDAVRKIAAEMVSGSEEAVLQGDQLHNLAFNLEQSVGGFNVDGNSDETSSGGSSPNLPALRGSSHNRRS